MAQQTPVYTGTREAPISGVWLRPAPFVFFRDFSGQLGNAPDRMRIGNDESTRFTPDWRHVVRYRSHDGQTDLRLDEGPVWVRPGVVEPALSQAGDAVLTTTYDEDGVARAELLDGDGDPLHGYVAAEGLLWVALSDGGGRVVLGTGGKVLVFDGALALLTLQNASLGALSADGLQLVLERGPAGARSLQLVSLGGGQGPSWTQSVPGTATKLSFSGDKILRVAPGRLQVFDAASNSPAPELDVQPPTGFAWRDAARGPQGQIAGGRLQVFQHAEVVAGPVFVPGAARYGIDLFEPNQPVRSFERDVTLWNHESPQLAFDGAGRLYAIVWPSAEEVHIP